MSPSFPHGALTSFVTHYYKLYCKGLRFGQQKKELRSLLPPSPALAGQELSGVAGGEGQEIEGDSSKVAVQAGTGLRRGRGFL